MSKKSTANSIDVHVGYQVRTRRKQLGKSSAEMAHALGLSEVDYLDKESGHIRLSAEELFGLAHLLSSRIAYFYDGLSGISIGAGDGETDSIEDGTDKVRQAARLQFLFSEITDDNEREYLIQLASTLGSDERLKTGNDPEN